MVTQVTIADSEPRANNNDAILAVAVAGVLIGGLLVVIGSAQNAAPPVGVNCPDQPCPNGTVCDPKTTSCVSQGDGGGGTGCPACGSGICCSPWTCYSPMLGLPATCIAVNGGGGSGASQCLQPCAINGLVCNPHTHQCEHGNSNGWNVDWNVLPGQQIGFFEDVNPMIMTGDGRGGDLPFPLDAAIEFNYIGPGGPATAGFSVKSDDISGQGLCQYAFSSHSQVFLDPASAPTPVAIATFGILWPDNCLLCLTGLLHMTFTVYPYVILPDGPHYGPAMQGLLSC
jgi:hypothetical protein